MNLFNFMTLNCIFTYLFPDIADPDLSDTDNEIDSDNDDEDSDTNGKKTVS